ncbi:hypothetical protein AGMMS50284_7580 [Clostridia bacterium]|nr:hypothetical protein AGMMS50284_7540 [Clostridia bacterium]GHU83657.1 hypothetical protein AGMMS50284_7580 [Clostridia bacterium]
MQPGFSYAKDAKDYMANIYPWMMTEIQNSLWDTTHNYMNDPLSRYYNFTDFIYCDMAVLGKEFEMYNPEKARLGQYNGGYLVNLMVRPTLVDDLIGYHWLRLNDNLWEEKGGNSKAKKITNNDPIAAAKEGNYPGFVGYYYVK